LRLKKCIVALSATASLVWSGSLYLYAKPGGSQPVQQKVSPPGSVRMRTAQVTPKRAPTPTKRFAQKAAKAAAKTVRPSRGGSPRDYLAYMPQDSFGQSMARQALSYRGMPYIFGAQSPRRGFDCSGLIYFLLRQRGYNPPRTAAGLASYGRRIARADLQPGDILLFSNTYRRGVSHAGVYLGNNKFVHAANASKGVRVDRLFGSYYARKFHSARRVK
jgi:cell wall-associated NlpC family hydrolase